MNLRLQNTRTRSRSDRLLKGDQIAADREHEPSALFLLRDEFLPNFEKNSFLFQARDDGGRVIRAISMRAMTLATLRLEEKC
jgi:hypothetical protein